MGRPGKGGRWEDSKGGFSKFSSLKPAGWWRLAVTYRTITSVKACLSDPVCKKMC